jgi:hypothetical protein
MPGLRARKAGGEFGREKEMAIPFHIRGLLIYV